LALLGIGLGLVLVYGVVGYVALFGWRPVEALYMTVTTLTTVGFREVRPLDDAGIAFTLTLIVLGVGLVLTTIAIVAEMIGDGSLVALGRRRRMQRRIDALRDHFIVCAYGRVGRAVARQFDEEDIPFVVIDPKEELAERMAEDGRLHLIEDPTDEEVLRHAGVDRARGLVCAVDSDATNVYITLMARSLNPRLFIVARASEPGSDGRLQRAGADRVVSPFVASGRHMAMMALRPRVVDVLELGIAGRRSVELEELLIAPDSEHVGRRLGDVAPSATPLVVRRPDGTVVPNPDPGLELRAGDLVLMLPRVAGT
jgi:voltage-gated potassium channel